VNFLFVLSGVCWTLVYISLIYRGFKDKTYGMPLFALGLNIAWEVLYSIDGIFIHKANMPPVQNVANVVWAFFDILIVITFFRYGKKYFPEIGKKYFKTYEDEEHQPILDYTEEFTELMKFRIHRLEHKAQSGLQHVPNDIHQKVWKQVDKYAKEKYGEDYKNIPSYSKYKACYDVYDKVIRDLKE